MWLHPQLQSIGLIYGDSAIFARRATYEKIGGYKPIPVLEDVDFVKRLQKRGDFRFLTKAVTTSSRRFQNRADARNRFARPRGIADQAQS